MEKLTEANDFFTTFNEKKKTFEFGKIIRILDSVLNDLRMNFPDIFYELTRMSYDNDKNFTDISSTMKEYNSRLLSFMEKCDKYSLCKKYMRHLISLYEFMNNSATIISVNTTKMKTDFKNDSFDLQTSEFTLKVRNIFNSMCDFEPIIRIVRNMMHNRIQNNSFYNKYDNDRYKQKMADLLIYAYKTNEGCRENLQLQEKLHTINVSEDYNYVFYENEDTMTKDRFEETIFKPLLKSICEISMQAELYSNLNFNEKSYPIFLAFTI